LKIYKLFTPGPIDVPPDVLKRTARPLIYHREEKFKKLMDDVSAMLRRIIKTKGKLYFLTSSGTGAMEAACSNILSTADHPIIAVCGKFGERWVNLCRSYRVQADVVQVPYGRVVRPDMVEQAVKRLGKPTVIFTTLTETSTGVLSDIKAFGGIAKRYDSFLVVDGVAGVGADYCPQDEWNVDILIGASQKALMAPPGIAFLSLSERAFEKCRKSDLPKYYFDLELYEKFMQKGQTPWTPAITILYGLQAGLARITSEGVAHNFSRHKKIARFVRSRIQNMGFEIFPETPSSALSVMKMPATLDSTPIIGEIKERHYILFSNGQAEMKGKILRIGHMGNYTIAKMNSVLNILEKTISKWRE
jgi:aspartate aminotransferase-like enzyme